MLNKKKCFGMYHHQADSALKYQNNKTSIKQI